MILCALGFSGLCLECLAARLYTSFVTSYVALSVHAPKGATLLSIPNQATPGFDKAHAYGTEVLARRCLIAQHEAGYGPIGTTFRPPGGKQSRRVSLLRASGNSRHWQKRSLLLMARFLHYFPKLKIHPQ